MDERAFERRAALRRELASAFAEGAGASWPEDRFGALALEVFRYQSEANPVYGAFVRNRGIVPRDVGDWRAIPPVPTRAFKAVDLACEGSGSPEAVFRTSGTTRGADDRGTHVVRDLSLYRASLLASARAFLRPEFEARPGPLRVVALLPSPEDRPDSSLAYMAGALLDEWDDGGGGFFADRDWGLHLEAIDDALRRSCAEDVPVLLIGTAFAFVHWLDRGRGDREIRLPDGSRLMETGGFKGRSRTIAREELYASLEARLGLGTDRMVNEYGMTELLSQCYEPVLREGAPETLASRWHVGPPWMRTRVLDADSLAPVPPGSPGLLCHYDLANLDSVAAILTEDRGILVPGGFRLIGRTSGAEPRGCSLSMEDLVRSREAVR